MAMEESIVKFEGKYWVVDSIKENGMVTIWRDGQPAIVPLEMLEFTKEKKEGE